MAITVIFFDRNGNLISDLESHPLASYTKMTLDDQQRFHLAEHFDDDKLTAIEYFLRDGESFRKILDKYPDFERINFYIASAEAGKYAQYEVLTVNRNEIIESRRIQVLSDTLLPIYDRAIDIVTGQTLYFAKHYYDLNNNLDFEFTYEEGSGELTKIYVQDPHNYIDTDEHEILPPEVGKGKNPYDFDWDGFEYYRYSEPILPKE